MGDEGASVIVSSRKEANVKKAVNSLQSLGITAEGVVCHVGNEDQRKQLLNVVSTVMFTILSQSTYSTTNFNFTKLN